jgi:hypothetical protein
MMVIGAGWQAADQISTVFLAIFTDKIELELLWVNGSPPDFVFEKRLLMTGLNADHLQLR